MYICLPMCILFSFALSLAFDRRFLAFCRITYISLRRIVDDHVFAGVVCIIQLILLELRLTLRDVHVHVCMFVEVQSLLFHSVFFSCVLSNNIYIIATYSGRPYFCWCCVHHSAHFAGVATYTSFVVL